MASTSDPTHHRIIPEHLSHPHLPARIPNIPDLRFENSYLRSIRPFVHVRRLRNDPPTNLKSDYEVLSADGKGKSVQYELSISQEVAVAIPSEEIVIDWAKVLWVTTRDQVISPFIQGAVWGVAGHFIIPLMKRFRANSARYLRTRLAVGEGQGITWLRNWVKSFSSVTTPERRKVA